MLQNGSSNPADNGSQSHGLFIHASIQLGADVGDFDGLPDGANVAVGYLDGILLGAAVGSAMYSI